MKQMRDGPSKMYERGKAVRAMKRMKSYEHQLTRNRQRTQSSNEGQVQNTYI